MLLQRRSKRGVALRPAAAPLGALPRPLPREGDDGHSSANEALAGRRFMKRTASVTPLHQTTSQSRCSPTSGLRINLLGQSRTSVDLSSAPVSETLRISHGISLRPPLDTIRAL